VQFSKPSTPRENTHQGVSTSTSKINSVDNAGLQGQAPRSVPIAEQTGSNWLWWFVPLLLFLVLFMLMQNSRLLQSLVAQDEAPSLQSRVDLGQSSTETRQENSLNNDVSLYAPSEPSSIATAGKMKADSTVQIADDLTDTLYIEPDSGDLTITVNDYEEDDLAEDASPAEVPAQGQLAVQAQAGTHQELHQEAASQQRETETEYAQTTPLSEAEIVDSELVHVDKKQEPPGMDITESETMEPAAVEGVADKVALQKSRRLQHIVVKGDTLWSITGRYINKPWLYPEIARLSNIDNPNLIYPGQRVIIVLNYKNRSR
jgi:LysM repeat protein